MTKRERLLVLIPALWASLFDIIITIIYQPKEYWSGNLKAKNEGNPIGALFMESHVAGLFVISFLWLVLIGVLGYYLPRRISRVFLLFVLMAQTYGACTWVNLKLGFWYVMAFILFNAILFYIVDDKVFKVKSTTAVNR